MKTKFKNPKTWRDIVNDPRVADAWRDSDGYWVAVKQEYYSRFMTGNASSRQDVARQMHEQTVARMASVMQDIGEITEIPNL